MFSGGLRLHNLWLNDGLSEILALEQRQESFTTLLNTLSNIQRRLE